LSYSPMCGRFSAHGPIYQIGYWAATGVILESSFPGELYDAAWTPFAGHHEVQVFVGIRPYAVTRPVDL